MKTIVVTTLTAAFLAAASFAYADTKPQAGSGSDPETTGSIENQRPGVSEELRTFCNSEPDDAKCKAENLGEINKGN